MRFSRRPQGSLTARGQNLRKKEFSLAVVVLSRRRLLDEREMAYFEHLVKRAESEEPVLGREGLVGGIIHPFHVATGRRAFPSTVLFP